jgi:hypothetical protein
MAASRPQRVSIGFEGGQVLSARLTPESLSALQSALPGGGWHELATDEGVAHVDLARIVYVRVESDELRVGFGA